MTFCDTSLGNVFQNLILLSLNNTVSIICHLKSRFRNINLYENENYIKIFASSSQIQETIHSDF
jgi:hypothetical protein